MATNTYVALDKVTVGIATPSITFTGISQAYTDLVIVTNFALSANDQYAHYVRVNGDTGNNYSRTILYGSVNAAGSARNANSASMYFGTWNIDMDTTDRAVTTIFFNNYSNTTTYKTAIGRWNVASKEVGAGVGLWRSTDAITSINLSSNTTTYTVGSTFTLYGIASTEKLAPKAFCGIITQDDTYTYHTFGASGTFTPQQSLTCDYIVVAGGGGSGGGNSYGGTSGGGAGGYRSFTAQSLTATPYTITVGAGGNGGAAPGGGGGTNGSNGVDSTFNSHTATGGGAGTTTTGASGGSGGGAYGYPSGQWSGGAGNTPSTSPSQGNNGGLGSSDNAVYTHSGGGGGAGQVGGNSTTTRGGLGGNGIQWLNNSYYAGGGGGGGASNTGTSNAAGGLGGGGAGKYISGQVGDAGVTNTGGGGGGSSGGGSVTGASGGSGVVIIRYANQGEIDDC